MRAITNLEFKRRKLELSQDRLAHDTRVAQYFISLMEMGRGIPNDDQRARIARRLGLSPAELLLPVAVATEEQSA